jgi:molybdenum cofactor guanylyltransferase
MGRDKAFLKFNGKPFVAILTEEISNLSDDIIVVVGRKGIRRFKQVLSPAIRIAKDAYDLGSPASGIQTGFKLAKYSYSFVAACDTPLLKSAIVGFLRRQARNHSAAIPRWPNGDIEPLCAVYKVKEALKALDAANKKLGKFGPRNMISQLKDVNYVSTSLLRRYDKNLDSLFNVNDESEYKRLIKKAHSE